VQRSRSRTSRPSHPKLSYKTTAGEEAIGRSRLTRSVVVASTCNGPCYGLGVAGSLRPVSRPMTSHLLTHSDSREDALELLFPTPVGLGAAGRPNSSPGFHPSRLAASMSSAPIVHVSPSQQASHYSLPTRPLDPGYQASPNPLGHRQDAVVKERRKNQQAAAWHEYLARARHTKEFELTTFIFRRIR
jgi:hypothetical protein